MKHLCTLVLAIFAALLLSTPAKADVAGIINVSNCVGAGNGMTLTATTIDFTLPVGGGNGCTETTTGTSITYTGGGPLTSTVTGLVKDLSVPSGTVLDFMTFTGNPNLHFDLTSLGPGVANTNCASLFVECSPSPGSPFVLTGTPSGTSLSLSASGVARDASGHSSTWFGSFSTQFPGVTAASIQTTLNGGGTISSTYSGSFTVTAASQVPEPTTILLLGTGLAGIAAKVRKRRKAV